MSAFRIVQRHEDLFWIFHGDRKVANLFPARPALEWPAGVRLFIAEPWSIIPDPEAFPDAACTGLPRPLSPSGDRFDSFAAVERFLGLQTVREAA
ncbi:hypothetical protein [Methylobacterium sp. WL7]|uniref:hypothetical protein n=1 Tax=Methylobacterium sp. WL7 TaxID=2603900 RepID=UPI0011CCC7F7|nr:hypothetical protein [Methylobacterium sp. WL7]TXN40511.1 hypothetical protein FV233_26585 [Methylobacterium sp. WL7]